MDFTLVLVGLTGHGKSATGNSILGREAFISRAHSSSVTETCERQTSVLEDGRTISVIDTPGFLDKQPELLGEEVKKCFHLARDRIHAFLLVTSREQRISAKNAIDAVGKLKTIFGENIMNYMILVFTHNDTETFYYNSVMTRAGMTLEDEKRKSRIVQNLLSEVKTVMSNNGGKPFMSQVLELQLQVEARLRDTTTRLEQQMEAATLKADERAEKYLKEETSELIKQISKSYEEQMTLRLEAVEQRVLDMATQQMKINEIAQQQMTQRFNEEGELMKDVTTRLEKQLAEAEDARLKADERAQEAQKNSDEQIQMLKEVLERAESKRSVTNFESSSFHVYDPSTYLLQSTIK